MNEQNETEAIRSDIDVTRRRMDETMDALGDRLKGRHLLDEILGFFRRSDSDADGTRQKLARSTRAAVDSVVGTIKENPMPTLLIGAGVAWMIYSARKNKASEQYSVEEYGEFDYSSGTRVARETRYDPDVHFDRPLEYPTAGGMGSQFSGGGGMGQTFGEKASSAKEQVKEKLGALGESAKEKMSAVREKAGELGGRAQERTREIYTNTKQRVASTANEHPLEMALGCLALGLVAGLAIPTPNRVKRMAGPAVDRLKNRTREAGAEMMEKGKRVVRAATTAAQHEAQTQGLTTETGGLAGSGGGTYRPEGSSPLATGPMTTENTGESALAGDESAANPTGARPM